MTVAIQRRRGTTSQHSAFSGLQGELTVDTSKNTVVVHDGATLGGHPLALESVVSGLSGGVSSHVGATSGVHGVSGDVVGTTGAQTLTNKTLTSPVVNSPVVNSPTISDPVINGAAFNPSAAARSICGTAYHSLLGIVCPPSFERKAWDSKDLTNGIPTGMTFSRPSTATYFDAAGVMQSAASGALRHDFDPATGEYKGWLLEGQATNLLLYSQDYSNASWAVINSCSKSSSRITATQTLSAVYQTFSISAASVSRCFWARIAKTSTSSRMQLTGYCGGGTTIQKSITVSATTGSVISLSSGATGGCIDKGKEWLVWISFSDNGTNNSAFLEIFPDTVSGVNYVDVNGTQAEVGAYPTSYIPTTSAQVTRAADSLSIATSAFPFNAAEGTLYVEAITNASSVCPSGTHETLASLNDGSSSERSLLRRTTTTAYIDAVMVDGGVTQVNLNAGSAAAFSVARAAYAYKLNGCAEDMNGGAVVTDTSATIPTVTTLNVGSDWLGSFPFNAHIRHLAYFPRRLSNAELQLLTK